MFILKHLKHLSQSFLKLDLSLSQGRRESSHLEPSFPLSPSSFALQDVLPSFWSHTPIQVPISVLMPQTILHLGFLTDSGPRRGFLGGLSEIPGLSWWPKSRTWSNNCKLEVCLQKPPAALWRFPFFTYPEMLTSLSREVPLLLTHLRWVKASSSHSLSFLFLRVSYTISLK